MSRGREQAYSRSARARFRVYTARTGPGPGGTCRSEEGDDTGVQGRPTASTAEYTGAAAVA